MAGAHLARGQWRTGENWNPGAVIDKFRRGREAVRDKGVTAEGKMALGGPVSVTDWASGLQCMVPSPRGCQGLGACHSEVCEPGLDSRPASEAAQRPCAAFEPQGAGDCCFRAARRPCQGPHPRPFGQQALEGDDAGSCARAVVLLRR